MNIRLASLSACIVLALLAGCGPKSGSDVSDLQQAFPKDKAVTPQQKEVQTLVDSAAEAAQKGEFEKAAAALTVLQKQEDLSPVQRAAVHDQMGSLQMDLVTRAEAGDAAAKRALEAIRGLNRR